MNIRREQQRFHGCGFNALEPAPFRHNPTQFEVLLLKLRILTLASTTIRASWMRAHARTRHLRKRATRAIPRSLAAFSTRALVKRS